MTRTKLADTLQFFRFGVVGVLATLIHVPLYFLFSSLIGIEPFFSNLFAFLIAAGFGLLLHAKWTFEQAFRKRSSRTHTLIARFFYTALLGLLLNSSYVYLLVDLMALHYAWPVVGFVFVTPVLTFLINKFWVFK